MTVRRNGTFLFGWPK